MTIRSDRSQNSRLEALNLIRNRRGRAPHIMVVTAEPLPTRLASVASGTGDFDCVYHIALPELLAATEEAAVNARSMKPQILIARSQQVKQLLLLVDANRLKDIADLPLDLLT